MSGENLHMFGKAQKVYGKPDVVQIVKNNQGKSTCTMAPRWLVVDSYRQALTWKNGHFLYELFHLRSWGGGIGKITDYPLIFLFFRRPLPTYFFSEPPTNFFAPSKDLKINAIAVLLSTVKNGIPWSYHFGMWSVMSPQSTPCIHFVIIITSNTVSPVLQFRLLQKWENYILDNSFLPWIIINQWIIW